jgi:hypothetical protein
MCLLVDNVSQVEMPLDNMTCCANFKRILSGEWSNPKTDLNYFASLVISFLSNKEGIKAQRKLEITFLNLVSVVGGFEDTKSFGQKSIGQMAFS